MTKHLRAIKICFIAGILFSGIFLCMIPEKAEAARAISFNSYIDFEYDISPLNQPLEIDVSITVPITVKYSTDIPPAIDKIPWPFDYIFLYGNMIAPMQKIHLEVLNPPDWANIYLSSPDVIVDIPIGDVVKERTTNLILSPRVDAPAVSYKIDIKATCETIKRVNDFTYQESLEFTPSFIPTIQINPDDPIRTIGPHESVTFEIKVQNLGNKITRVKPILKEADDKWTPTINPPEYEISPNSENIFKFSIIAPFDFGWHNEYGRFEIEFLSEVYPYRLEAASTRESIFLVVNNYGFSTPSFEFPLLLAALIGMIYIIRKKQMKR